MPQKIGGINRAFKLWLIFVKLVIENEVKAKLAQFRQIRRDLRRAKIWGKIPQPL
jgi:hypothetical protein